MRPTRTNWNKLLDLAEQPLWVVDASWQIVLTNLALRAWWGDGSEQLAGLEIRYGISSADTTQTDLASALAPDPAVFLGSMLQATIVNPRDPAQQLQVQWLPLFDTAGEVVAAIAWGTRTEALALGAPARISAAADWHALLAKHRARVRATTLDRFVGTSLEMQTLRARAELAARQGTPVWIFGPTGSGRRKLARAICALHTDVPLIECDAAVLTSELLQQNLRQFLSAQRSSTLGASETATADIFIANAQHLSEAALVELKTIHETGKVRFVLTSDRAPEKLPQAGQWPKSLLAALTALTIEVPPLGSRGEDLPLLVQLLLEEQNLAGAKQVRGCSLAALELLAAYRWPGDVAELAELLRAAHTAADGIEIQPGDLPAWLRQAESALSSPRTPPVPIDLDQQLAEMELELLARALRLAGGNKTQAAKLVGWTRQRLLRRGEELGLLRPAEKSPASEPEFIPDLPFEPEE